MKKKILDIFICMLLIATTVSPVTSVQNTAIHATPLSRHLPRMGTMATLVPTGRPLNNSRMPLMEPNRSTQSRSFGSWIQQAKLLASDGAAEDYFSSLGLSISGDTALIGAWADDDNGADSGSAYVFTRTGTTWTEQAKLLASDGTAGDSFGWWVAIEGDTALIGAAGDDMLKGSAYVFTRTGITWTEQTKLVAADGAAGDQFGYSVYLSGDAAIIGANCDDDNGFDSGSAYVFIRIGTTWTQQTKLLASDGATQDSFGGEVSISGDTALIGACFDDDNGFDSGSAYVFVRTGTTWTEQAKLRASDGAVGDYFSAYAVSISSDTALIGAQGDDDNGADSGSAYVFIRTGTTWTEQAKLLASDGAAQDFFGGSVSLSGDTVLIGAGGDDVNGGNSGSAYMFIRTDITWAQEAKLFASDGAAEDIFGWDVAFDGDTVLIGAYYDDDNGVDSGSAYVFTKNQPPIADFSWMPQNPNTNQQIVFNASASQDPDGTITRYEWDWDNDGVYDEAQSSPTTTHSWSSAGNYPIRLRAIDEYNGTGTVTKTVTVNGTVNFTIDITGGLGVNAVITNNGTKTATNVKWTFTLTGGFILLGKTKSGTLLPLDPGASKTVKDAPILGFGKTTIKVEVICAEGISAIQTKTGFIILFFVIGVK
jgi:hypothetical protein